VRILFFTGKGGVGKTTLAAATAVRLTAPARRVLVVSTDPAHSLSDAFGVPLSSDPSEVADSGLYAAHVDARGLVDDAWQDLRGHLRDVLAGVGVDELDAEELTLLPGVDELLALGEVARLAGTGRWDVVVVDCGPTAETLRLLALPEAVGGYLERIFGRDSMRGLVTSLVSGAGWGARPAAADAIGRLAEHLGGLRELLADHTVTGVRLVLTPERVVVAESRRTLAALALRGIQVDRIIANRVVPRAGIRRGPAATWLRTRRDEQDAVLAELRAAIPAGLAVDVVEHRAAEPVGITALAALADELYGGRDPLADVGRTAPSLLQVRPLDGGGYLLKVAVPLTEQSEVDLVRVGDDLAVTVDGTRRVVALPSVLRSCVVMDAEADVDGLAVRFDAPMATGAVAT